MSRFSKISFAIIFFATSVAQAEDSKEYLLRYKFIEGQVIRYEVSSRDDYVIKIGMDEDTPFSYQDSVKNYRVISVDQDGLATLELMNMEWVKTHVNQNGQQAEYDSRENEEPETLFAPLASMVGKKHLRVDISATGDIVRIETLLKKDKEVKELAQDVLVKLPEEPVKVGGLWKEDVTVPLNLPGGSLKQNIKLQRRYFIQSVKDGIAKISMKTKILTPLNNADLEIQLIRRQPEGTILFDLEKGLVISREVTQNNQVVNFGQGASQMTFTQKHTEKLLPGDIATGESEVIQK